MRFSYQKTLFGDRVIPSIGWDNKRMVSDILWLHNNGEPVELDPTYSIGYFYSESNHPKLCFDINPQKHFVKKADCRDLPLEDKSIKSIMFDPPFLIGGKDNPEVKKGSNIVKRRFGVFMSLDELRDMYSNSLKEFNRILIDDGLLIFKCQDTVGIGINEFVHVHVMNDAVKFNFRPVDLFVLLVKSVIIGNTKKQRHARKYHSYFWVFRKN